MERAREFAAGTSPRLRGAWIGGLLLLGKFGNIPALAGSILCSRCQPLQRREHPRACGEHAHPMRRNRRDSGTSPRLRGA